MNNRDFEIMYFAPGDPAEDANAVPEFIKKLQDDISRACAIPPDSRFGRQVFMSTPKTQTNRIEEEWMRSRMR